MRFRFLDEPLMNDLLNQNNKLNFILQFERLNRNSVIVELRKGYLDLYFLGHAIVVRKISNNYYLVAANEFNPTSLLLANESAAIQPHGKKAWKISFEKINDYNHFQNILSAVQSKIVVHRHGNISEGVSELNHFIDNRVASKNGVLIIDRQVVYPSRKDLRIDLLGLRRLPESEKYTFCVIELKNRNNPDIGKVFTQTQNYLDLLNDEKVYNDFRETYQTILSQKINLRLLKRTRCQLAEYTELQQGSITGIVILDNYNIRSVLNPKSSLWLALDDWEKIDNNTNIVLFFKTNLIHTTLTMNRLTTKNLIKTFIANSR